MAKGVHAALLEILQQYGDMSADAATACLSDMAKAGRYVRDIWSA
jgi:sulfite reductase alpha subunit-like flavoprotein